MLSEVSGDASAQRREVAGLVGHYGKSQTGLERRVQGKMLAFTN
jgi:hypothetical protein